MTFTVDAIHAAAERLRGHIVHTPLLDAPLFDAEYGLTLLLKAEPLQRTGAFKFRGALNKVLATPEAERRRGFAAFSSGNHGNAVAAAARLVGAPAVIVMPKDAPRIKVESCRANGGEIIFYDRATEDREAVTARIVAERGAVLIRPFDDPDVMAGQGTIGLEIADAMRARGAVPDDVVVCCSGGGLAAGVATAIRAAFPDTRCLTAEPAGFDKMRRSLAAGAPQRNERITGSIMDALMAPVPGSLTLPALRAAGAAGLTATDDEARAAMAAAFRHFKLVVEPGGAAALAAVMARRDEFAGRTVVVVASGGNVDRDVYVEALQRAG